jgi:hypothetical protein
LQAAQAMSRGEYAGLGKPEQCHHHAPNWPEAHTGTGYDAKAAEWKAKLGGDVGDFWGANLAAGACVYAQAGISA